MNNEYVLTDITNKYEVVIIRQNGKEEVIHSNLTLEKAIEYFENIDNTYITKMNNKL